MFFVFLTNLKILFLFPNYAKATLCPLFFPMAFSSQGLEYGGDPSTNKE